MVILILCSTLIRFVLLGWGRRGVLILVRDSTLIRFVLLGWGGREGCANLSA